MNKNNKRKLHIKQIKREDGGYDIMVMDRTYLKAGVPLITFKEGDMNENMQDALDYCSVLQRVGGNHLVWN